jgi:hypothetical protein
VPFVLNHNSSLPSHHEQKLKNSPLREDKQKAVDMHKRQKEMMEDLKVIIAARDLGQPLPR